MSEYIPTINQEQKQRLILELTEYIDTKIYTDAITKSIKELEYIISDYNDNTLFKKVIDIIEEFKQTISVLEHSRQKDFVHGIKNLILKPKLQNSLYSEIRDIIQQLENIDVSKNKKNEFTRKEKEYYNYISKNLDVTVKDLADFFKVQECTAQTHIIHIANKLGYMDNEFSNIKLYIKKNPKIS